jgi:predicted DNA-binding transcriptional regulator AlpA
MFPNRSASSIEQFCESHNISRAHFYQLCASGRGPRLIKLGRRVIISQEAAADWRRDMEARTAAQTQT